MDGLGRTTALRAVVATVLLLLLVQLANAYPNPSPQHHDGILQVTQLPKRQDMGIATVPAEADEPMAQSSFADPNDGGDLVLSRGPVDPLQGDNSDDDGDSFGGAADGPALTDSIPSPTAYAVQTEVPSTADAGGEGPIIEANSSGHAPLSGYPALTNLALPGSGSESAHAQPQETGSVGALAKPQAAKGVGSEAGKNEPAEPSIAIPAPIDFGFDQPQGDDQDDQPEFAVAAEESLNMNQGSGGGSRRLNYVTPATLRKVIRKRGEEAAATGKMAPIVVTKVQYVIALTHAEAPGLPVNAPAFLRSTNEDWKDDIEVFSVEKGEYIPVFGGSKSKPSDSSESVALSIGGDELNAPATASGNMNLPILTGAWNATTSTDDGNGIEGWMTHRPTNTVTITIGPHGELPSDLPPEIAAAISAALGNGLTAFPYDDDNEAKTGSNHAQVPWRSPVAPAVLAPATPAPVAA